MDFAEIFYLFVLWTDLCVCLFVCWLVMVVGISRIDAEMSLHVWRHSVVLYRFRVHEQACRWFAPCGCVETGFFLRYTAVSFRETTVLRCRCRSNRFLYFDVLVSIGVCVSVCGGEGVAVPFSGRGFRCALAVGVGCPVPGLLARCTLVVHSPVLQSIECTVAICTD